MGANPHANGGLLLSPLKLPDFREYAEPVDKPGSAYGEATRVVGRFLRDVIALNRDNHNFRLVCPDETTSNRLNSVFEVTNRVFMDKILPGDDHLSPAIYLGEDPSLH